VRPRYCEESIWTLGAEDLRSTVRSDLQRDDEIVPAYVVVKIPQLSGDKSSWPCTEAATRSPTSGSRSALEGAGRPSGLPTQAGGLCTYGPWWETVSPMPANNLRELFVHDLEDVYYAEQELLEALEDLEEQTETQEFAQAFADHRDETQGHLDRLEEVFEMLDMEPEVEECEGIEGLVEEHEGFVEEEDPSQEVLDLHNLVAAQKTEHYEIAAYGNLALIADRLGMDEAGDLLHENLEEEQETLDELSSFVDDYDYGRVTEQPAD
jgi:ferritin-like metal-binding protein YciE